MTLSIVLTANVGKMHTKSLEGFGVSDEKVADLLVSILPFAQSLAKGEDGEIQIGTTMPKLDVQLVYYYGILYLTNRKISWEVFPNVKTGKELTPFIKEWIAKQ